VFTKGDVAIFTAATALLGLLWDSDDDQVIKMRKTLLSGANLGHVEQALMKLTLIVMMDNQSEDEETEEPKPKKKERKTEITKSSEEGEIKMVFTIDD